MGWDFATEPEFEERLVWMRAFVRNEIWPIETIADDLGQDELDRIYAPLREVHVNPRAESASLADDFDRGL